MHDNALPVFTFPNNLDKTNESRVYLWEDGPMKYPSDRSHTVEKKKKQE